VSRRTNYDLSLIEQNDLVTVRLGHTVFHAIVTAQPSAVSIEAMDRFGVRMVVPASLVLGHSERVPRLVKAAA